MSGITDPLEKYFKDGVWGWTGTLWVPVLADASGHLLIDGQSPSLLRPSPKSALYLNESLPAGTSDQDAATVPAGEYWRFTFSCVTYSGAVTGVGLYPYVKNLSTTLYYQSVTTVVSGARYPQILDILLGPGWKIGCTVVGATLNNDLYMWYFCERVY